MTLVKAQIYFYFIFFFFYSFCPQRSAAAAISFPISEKMMECRTVMWCVLTCILIYIFITWRHKWTSTTSLYFLCDTHTRLITVQPGNILHLAVGLIHAPSSHLPLLDESPELIYTSYLSTQFNTVKSYSTWFLILQTNLIKSFFLYMKQFPQHNKVLLITLYYNVLGV